MPLGDFDLFRGTPGADGSGRGERGRREARPRRTIVRRGRLGVVAALTSAFLVFGTVMGAQADTSAAPAPESATTATPAPTESAADTTVEAPAAPVAEEVPAVEDAAVDETETASDAQPEAETAEAPEAALADVTEDAALAPTTTEAAQIAPLAIGDTVLRVTKLGDRTGDGGVTTLAGATFSAIAGTSTVQPGIDATSPYTCTTDAAGVCDITVPATAGAASGYWVVESSAPAGWNRLVAIGTGQHTDPKSASPYMFFTGPVSGGVVAVTADTVAFRNAADGQRTATTTSDGVVNARGNAPLPASCGLNIALVFDTSQSINEAKMTQMKAAAADFIGEDGLAGTASTVALYRFGTNAGKLLDATSVLTPTGQGEVATAIEDGLGIDGFGFTNWDAAFRQVAFDPAEDYDVVLFLSDGDPTTWGTDGGSNVNTNVSFRNVEEGVLSANALKSQVGPAGAATKVIGVGIEPTANSYLNLQAVSGPVEDEDYYLTDFPGLAAELRDIATENCGGTLTITKKTIDADGTVIDEDADGWTFTGTTPGASILGPDGPTDTLSLTTGDVSEGSVNFPIAFDERGAPVPVTVTEDVQAGWSLVDVDCSTTPVVGPGDFTVDVAPNDIVTCTVTNQQAGGSGDVGIEKAAVIDGAPVTEPLESGDLFDYVLTVTNTAETTANDVVVTDPIPARLAVTGITLPEGDEWSNDNAPALVGPDNTVSLSTPSLAPGESVDIVISVEVSAIAPPAVPNLGPNDPAPALPELPQSMLANEACVDALVDDDPTNDCATATVETKDIAAVVYTRCIADAPLLGFVVAKTPNLAADPVNLEWYALERQPDTDPYVVTESYDGASVSEEIPWPGSAFSPSGISIDYPGWRAIEERDIVPGTNPTQYYNPANGQVMTPPEQAEFVFNGLILDPSELDFAWRETTRVTLSVNPTVTVDVAYPAATAGCSVARHTDVQIDKTASVERTHPGESFSYALAVQNVSTDSAADGIVVTDEIPADIRVTDVTWPGEGDVATFPNWESCEVTGQTAGGYGGTLACTLFGPLQPQGSDNGGASAAPTITLAATVSPTTTASAIDNIGVVDYYTFGDPADAGRDADEATIVLGGLPATGAGTILPLVLLGMLTLGAGITALVIRRRRGAGTLS